MRYLYDAADEAEIKEWLSGLWPSHPLKIQRAIQIGELTGNYTCEPATAAAV